MHELVFNHANPASDRPLDLKTLRQQEHKYGPSLTASEEFGKTVLWSCLDAVVWVMMVTLVGLGPKMSCT